MKKKSEKVEKEVEKDLEEEEEEDEASSSDADDSDEGEDEPEARPAVSVRAASRAKAARRPVAKARPVADDHDHDHDDHAEGHDHDEEEEPEGEDPTWWIPHAVMSALVLVGVLGFFGAFNKLLAPLAAHPKQATEETAKEETKVADAPKPATPPMPQQPAMPQQPRELFAAKHLLVMYKGSRRAPESITRSKDEAKARATEAMKKARGGKKFEEVVAEYSDEPNAAARGGNLGTFAKGSMVPEFQNALDKMKIGDISDLVETPFGYHVILRTQPEAPQAPQGMPQPGR